MERVLARAAFPPALPSGAPVAMGSLSGPAGSLRSQEPPSGGLGVLTQLAAPCGQIVTGLPQALLQE